MTDNAPTSPAPAAIILAAGQGTRMGGDKAKVLFEVAGQPMLHWVIQACKDVHAEIDRAVAEVAKKRGVALVINRSARPTKGKTRFEYLDRLSMRDVTYVDSSLDITEDVARALKIDPAKLKEKK